MPLTIAPKRGIVSTLPAPCTAPTAAFSHGGTVMTNPELFLMFWGSFWSSGPSPSAKDIAAAVSTIVSGSYLSALQQFGVTNPTLVNSFIVDYSVGSSPADPTAPVCGYPQLEQFLYDLVGFGLLPQPRFTTGALYCVFLPPGVTVDPNDLGAHTVLWFPKWPPAFYAWVSTGNVLDEITRVFSHELVESISDPFPGGGIAAPPGSLPPAIYPPGVPVEVGDVCNPAAARLDGVMVAKYWSVRDDAGMIPVAQLPLQAPRFWLPATLGQIRDGWMRHVPANTGGTCNPPNPNVTRFDNILHQNVPGVRLTAASNTPQCCTCIAETHMFSLLAPLNTDDVLIMGSHFQADRGPEPFSIAGMGIRLLRQQAAIRGASRLFLAELGRPNNCAQGFDGQELLQNGVPFVINPSTLASGVLFDAIEFSLASYACENATNWVEVAGLQVVLNA
jgi:hypothetical protein